MKEHELSAAAEEIRILIAILAKRGRQDLQQHLENHSARIGIVHYGVLRALLESSRTISEISKSMFLEPATLVPVVDDLEKSGYVRRGHDPQDRRRNPIELTEAGVELLNSIPVWLGKGAFFEALMKMPSEHVRELRNLLHELASSVMRDPEFAARFAEKVCLHTSSQAPSSHLQHQARSKVPR